MTGKARTIGSISTTGSPGFPPFSRSRVERRAVALSRVLNVTGALCVESRGASGHGPAISVSGDAMATPWPLRPAALGRDRVVDRDLLDLWRRRRVFALGLYRRPESLLLEAVEGLARLPEVDHAPAVLGRSRGVEHESR